MAWIIMIFYSFYIAVATGVQHINKVDEPRNHNIGYSNYGKICSWWSRTIRYNDFSSSSTVMDYSEYAPTIDAFIEKYPLVTIHTAGKAISTSTFGDLGKGQFGTLLFETINFKKTNYFDEHMVKRHRYYMFAYDVGVEIGIGFKHDGSKLILRPFINGWIYSVGAYHRCLEFGLSVTNITFYPKSNLQFVDVIMSYLSNMNNSIVQ